MPDTRPGFQQTQYTFAAYIRDPAINPVPAGVKPERMAVYRELFLNNVDGFIANGFPVLRRILDGEHWQALIHDFFARHRCVTPYFSGIPEEFLAYLRDERLGGPNDYPFLLELAHYEWVELALFVDENDPPQENTCLSSEILERPLVLSPVAWPLAYHYPVHRISPDFLPLEPPADPTLLTVYRDRDDQVRFLELNPVSYRLLQMLEENGEQTGKHYLTLLATELGHADPEAILGHGKNLLQDLAERGIVGIAHNYTS